MHTSSTIKQKLDKKKQLQPFSLPEEATLYEMRSSSKEMEFYPITPSEGIALEDSELYLYSSFLDIHSHTLEVERGLKSFDRSYSEKIISFKSHGNFSMVVT